MIVLVLLLVPVCLFIPVIDFGMVEFPVAAAFFVMMDTAARAQIGTKLKFVSMLSYSLYLLILLLLMLLILPPMPVLVFIPFVVFGLVLLLVLLLLLVWACMFLL